MTPPCPTLWLAQPGSTKTSWTQRESPPTTTQTVTTTKTPPAVVYLTPSLKDTPTPAMNHSSDLAELLLVIDELPVDPLKHSHTTCRTGVGPPLQSIVSDPHPSHPADYHDKGLTTMRSRDHRLLRSLLLLEL